MANQVPLATQDGTALPLVPTEAMNRRKLLTHAGVGAAALASFLALGKQAEAHGASGDVAIVQAAATAEALAVTMYYNIVKSPIYSTGLAAETDDQAYLVAGYEQELNHYNLLTSIAPALATTFYFPTGMFTDYQTTVNTLITLEDAFIAAYLIGVRDLSTPALKVLAAQICGVECEHRVLGRVIAADLGLTSTTGLSGSAESIVPPNHAPNNVAYERAFQPPLSTIASVVGALGPFVGAATAGFSKTPFTFAVASGLSQTVTLDVTGP